MQKIFAIADLHLSFGAPKPMDIFGDAWRNHAEKIADAWRAKISEDDLVLIAGDVSWAMKIAATAEDFSFLRALPGKKIIIRGNHDYWWDSLKKNAAAAGNNFFFIQNSAEIFAETAITGSRLWNFPFIKWGGQWFAPAEPRTQKSPDENANKRAEDDEKIAARELQRLRAGLEKMPRDAKLKIVMTHFPPISAEPSVNAITEMLAEFSVDICVYGHIHSLLYPPPAADCCISGTRYRLISADFLNFIPLTLRE